MTRKTLNQLFAEHVGKLSHKWSIYLDEYDRLFEECRDKSIRLLEIGVQNGGSIEILAKFFEKATFLIGCDNNPKCRDLRYDDSRIKIVVGDINSCAVFDQVRRYSTELDVIIDDGSHCSSDIVCSFTKYFPRLSDGGLYIVEDLHCSYWEKYQGGLFYPYSSISFFKRLVDIINHQHWGIDKTRLDALSGILDEYGCNIDEAVLSEIHSVEFINSLCVIRKYCPIINTLGNHVVVGSEAEVDLGSQGLHGQPCEFNLIFDESNNPWSNRTTPPDEALLSTEQLLENSRQQVAELNREIEDMQRVQEITEHSLEDSRQQVAELNCEIEDMQRAQEITEHSLDDSRQQVAEQVREKEEVQRLQLITDQALHDSMEQVLVLKKETEELRNSRSWRITSPLRRIATFVKKL